MNGDGVRIGITAFLVNGEISDNLANQTDLTTRGGNQVFGFTGLMNDQAFEAKVFLCERARYFPEQVPGSVQVMLPVITTDRIHEPFRDRDGWKDYDNREYFVAGQEIAAYKFEYPLPEHPAEWEITPAHLWFTGQVGVPVWEYNTEANPNPRVPDATSAGRGIALGAKRMIPGDSGEPESVELGNVQTSFVVVNG
jgi:hypothetical protein